MASSKMAEQNDDFHCKRKLQILECREPIRKFKKCFIFWLSQTKLIQLTTFRIVLVVRMIF